MNKIFVFLLTITAALSSCKHIECPVEPNSCDEASLAIIDPNYLENGPNDPFQLLDASIKGDCLETIVSYGGGCGGAKFDLVGNGAYTFSIPPQTFLRLALDNQDPCDAIVTDTLNFNLTPTRGDFQRGPVLIRLEGWEELLEYNW